MSGFRVQVNEIEIDPKGRDAQTIDSELKTLDGYSGVTTRDGKVYVTYVGDSAALVAKESIVEKAID